MFKVNEISLDSLADEIGIDRETIAELLRIYCGEMTEEMQQVLSLFQKQDWSSLQKTVHNIKGVSANLSLEGMFSAAEALDYALKNNDIQDIKNKVSMLQEVFVMTLHSIEDLLTQHSLQAEEL